MKATEYVCVCVCVMKTTIYVCVCVCIMKTTTTIFSLNIKYFVYSRSTTINFAFDLLQFFFRQVAMYSQTKIIKAYRAWIDTL